MRRGRRIKIALLSQPLKGQSDIQWAWKCSVDKLRKFNLLLLHTYIFWWFFVSAEYFKVSLANNAFHSKANSFTLAESKFTSICGLFQETHGKGRLSCVLWTTCLQWTPCCSFPFLSPTLLSRPSILKVVMTVFNHRLMNNISDLLFPHINADRIYSSGLTWLIESYTLQTICQL